MKGGVSYISNRYSKVNNKYLKSYDPKQESKLIIRLDALQGYAMSKFLAISGFKWINLKEFDLDKYTSHSQRRCVLEVDPQYLKDLRELHNDYPLGPDKRGIKRKMLSYYQLTIADLYKTSIGKV